MHEPEQWSEDRADLPPRRGRPGYLAIARGAPVTTALIVAAVGVTIASFSGVDVGFLVLDARGVRSEPWRILGSTLPHGGTLHILFNSLCTWQFGIYLEHRLGSARTLFAYLVIAWISCLAEFTFSWIGIGLSGVVYGALMLLWRLEVHDPSRGVTITRMTLIWLGGWFLLCIGLTVFDILGIGNWAHGFGALAGLMLGWLWTNTSRRKALVPVALLVCGAMFVLARWGRTYVNLSDEGYLAELNPAEQLREAENCEDAVDYYERATQLAPERVAIYQRLGICYEELGREAEAQDAFRRALDAQLGTLDFGN